MRIKVGNQWFKAEPGCPVMIEFNDQDKSLIRDMDPDTTRLAYFKGPATVEEKSAWIGRPEAHDGSQAEVVAQMIWHRFASDSHIEWADETHKSEYLLLAHDILALPPVTRLN
jgi:hypothetical protein